MISSLVTTTEAAKGANDPIRLIKQLKRISPLTIYRSGQAMSGPNYQKYMLQILKAYNGSSRTKSLPIKQ